MLGQLKGLLMADFTSYHIITVNGVSSTPTAVELTPIPSTGRVERIQAYVTSGTLINQVRVDVFRVATPTSATNSVYSPGSLVAQPLDQSPYYWYQVDAAGGSGVHGSLFLQVSVDDATADHSVEIKLTIQNLVSQQ
jgi:hypothetical protein